MITIYYKNTTTTTTTTTMTKARMTTFIWQEYLLYQKQLHVQSFHIFNCNKIFGSKYYN